MSTVAAASVAKMPSADFHPTDRIRSKAGDLRFAESNHFPASQPQVVLLRRGPA